MDSCEHRDLAALAAGLRLGEADRADLGVGEGDPGHRPVVGLGQRLAQMSATQSRAWYTATWVKAPLPGHVADGPHARRDPHAAVDGDARGVLVETERAHPE